MAAHVVVCFRSPEVASEPGPHLEGASALVEQATARGGRLIAWGATIYAFAFEVDALQDAIELAIAVVQSERGTAGERAVGISEGPLADADVPTAKLRLTWGMPLVRATAFARAARPGEVLVDPQLGSARRGDLLTIGSRVGVYGKLRLRGLLLDVRHPWRTSLAESSRGLVRPELVEREGSPVLEPVPGSLSLLRAARGAGGSRLLTELEQSVEPARTLRLSPHPFGEPLGALRRAMLRAVTLGQAPLNLGGQAGHSLDALLAGEGLDPHSAAELLSGWLAPDASTDPAGVLVLDDAGEIDADTLEIVARALTSGGEPFRLVARISVDDPVPAGLAGLPVAQEIPLGALASPEAIALALRCTGGELDERAAQRWANRGGGLPLGIVESIREAFESGEIVWEEGRAVARLRTSGGGGARPPKHWIKERFAHHDPEGRRILEALAALGGQAEVRDLTEVVRRRSEAELDLEPALAVLEAAGWIQKGKPDLIGLPSASHRDGVLAAMKDQDFREWHRAACEVMAQRDRPLAIAAATVHAILAGEVDAARELSRRAGAVTRAVGLEATAAAFEQLADRGDASALGARNLFTSQLELARAVPSVWPEAARSSAPPELEDEPEPSSSRIEPVLSQETAQVLLSGQEGTAPRSSQPPPRAAVEALRRGDAAEVERVAAELRGDSRPALAERLQAMAKLARGETGDAIRRLRQAAETALRAASKDQCRTLLALAVALGAAGRQEEALMEALSALARARELGDAKGERACLLFLSRLSATAGHHDVAEAWTMVAEG